MCAAYSAKTFGGGGGGGTTYHDTGCPRGTTCDDKKSWGTTYCNISGPGGPPVGGTISCMTDP